MDDSTKTTFVVAARSLQILVDIERLTEKLKGDSTITKHIGILGCHGAGSEVEKVRSGTLPCELYSNAPMPI